jgi:hypothetical protein
MNLTPDFLLQLVIGVGSAVAVYAGIKSDLAVTHEKAMNAEKTATNAHKRIDSLLQKD